MRTLAFGSRGLLLVTWPIVLHPQEVAPILAIMGIPTPEWPTQAWGALARLIALQHVAVLRTSQARRRGDLSAFRFGVLVGAPSARGGASKGDFAESSDGAQLGSGSHSSPLVAAGARMTSLNRSNSAAGTGRRRFRARSQATRSRAHAGHLLT